jgi:type I restriction enzyme, S subunit
MGLPKNGRMNCRIHGKTSTRSKTGNIGRQQVDLQSRQIMQNNINSEEIRNLPIPNPSPKEQRALVKRIRDGVAAIARLQAERARRDERVREKVEQLILTA